MGGLEEVADVVVQVPGFVRAGGDGVDVYIEDGGGEGADAGDAAFFCGFAEGGGEGICAVICMAAWLEPAAEFAVEGEEGVAAIGAEQPGGACDVAGGVGAGEAMRGVQYEVEDAPGDVGALGVGVLVVQQVFAELHAVVRGDVHGGDCSAGGGKYKAKEKPLQMLQGLGQLDARRGTRTPTDRSTRSLV